MALYLKQKQKETIIEVVSKAQLVGVSGDPMAGGGASWNGGGGGDDFGASGGGASSSSSAPTGWKLLIYDGKGRDVIAPSLKVRELRDLGITLHMGIEKPRQPVPGVPAIYLCEPTEENIQRIAKDAAEELYQSFHINFISQIPRRLLELLAESLVGLPNIGHIRCFDRNLQYVAESNDLFHLMQTNNYQTLNSSTTTDNQMEANLQQTVLGICHVLQSQQVVPIVAHQAGSGASQEVAQRLTVAIGDLVKEQLLPPQATAGRPVLLVTDRSADLTAALHHPFTYRGLLTDCLGMRLNKVDIISSSAKAEGEDAAAAAAGGGAAAIDKKDIKSYEMDECSDQYYKHWASLGFDKIGDHLDGALAQYNAERSELSVDPNAASDAAGGGDGDSSLSRMLATMPKMVEKKRSLDAHTALGFTILECINGQGLDAFNGIEESVLKRERLDEQEIKDLLSTRGTKEDRQRFYLILYLLAKEEEVGKIESKYLPLVKPDGETFPALDYIKQLRMYGGGGRAADGGGSNTGWSMAQNWAGGLAKTLKGGTHAIFQLTRVVDALLHSQPRDRNSDQKKLVESLLGVDPKTKQSIELSNVRFTSCMVFSVGGGAVAELDELKEWESRNRGKYVSYGCTEMLTGSSFLAQLTALGTSDEPSAL